MAPLPISILTCRAPNPDARRAGQPCGTLLGHLPGYYRWLGVVARMPERPETEVYLRCPRHSCGAVHKYRVVLIEPLDLPESPSERPPASASG